MSTTAPVLRVAPTPSLRESDVQLAREAAPAQLKTVDGFLAGARRTAILLDMLAQGYIEYAFGFLEDDLEALPDDDSTPRSATRSPRARPASTTARSATPPPPRRSTTSTSATRSSKDVASAEAEAKKLDKDAAPGLFSPAWRWPPRST